MAGASFFFEYFHPKSLSLGLTRRGSAELGCENLLFE
jgi:hypothetical protein